MAKQTTVTLTDDIDGSEAAETVPFALDGKFYEIDLSAENADELRDALAGYVESARKVAASGGSAPRRASSPGSSTDREQNQKVRTWARDNGIQVAERGRIKAEVVAAYNADDPQMAKPAREPEMVPA